MKYTYHVVFGIDLNSSRSSAFSSNSVYSSGLNFRATANSEGGRHFFLHDQLQA